jgi:dTDP-4-amino-4,6-dideoxygalactose transaminase
LQLKYVDQVLAERQRIDSAYRVKLDGILGIRFLPLPEVQSGNYAYFPILVGPEYPLSRDELNERLRQHNIYPRRYFYPLISEFPMYRGFPSARHDNLPMALEIASQVLCLPIYSELEEQEQERIAHLVSSFVQKTSI